MDIDVIFVAQNFGQALAKCTKGCCLRYWRFPGTLQSALRILARYPFRGKYHSCPSRAFSPL